MLDSIAIVLPFILTSALLPRTLSFCKKRSTLAGGGLVVLVATTSLLLAVAASFKFPIPQLPIITTVSLLVFGLMIAHSGWQQDTKNRAPWRYMAINILAVGGSLIFLPQIINDVPLWVDRMVLAGLWLTLIQTYRLMDKVDGYIPVTTIIIAIGLSIIAKVVVLPALVIAGCCIGFIRFNRPKALLEVGYVGSSWIGFMLGGLFILAIASGTNTWSLITLALLPIADIITTLIITILKTGKVNITANNLWYHRALDLGMTHAQVLWRVSKINFLLFLLAIFGYVAHTSLYTLLFASFILAVVAGRIKWLEG